MPGIAIVTDSNSGITQIQGKELGISVLPMPFMINENTYYEDITLTRTEFYQAMVNDSNISTSQPSPESVMQVWNQLLEEYDEVVHIPMSSGLSGSCETAHMLSNDYHGRVKVVNNQRISVTQRQSVLDAIQLVQECKTAQEIKDILEAEKLNTSIYITLNTLYYLKKGGRITPAAAALGTILKLKPVLQIQGDKLDAFAKARTTTQAKSIMITAMKNDMLNRFGGIDKDKIDLYIAHTQNEAAAETFRTELLAEFPGFHIFTDHLSLSVACHIGPGSLAIACTKRR
ncbi:MAG: DegV family protein [Lachnospiraceae bacterium]